MFSRSLSANDVTQLYADVPAALFKFDESANATTFVNAAGTGDATCSDGTCPGSGLKGKVGSAVDFDGMNDYLTMPDAPTVNTDGPFAVAVWLKADAWDNSPHILQKGNSSSGQYRLWAEKGALKFSVKEDVYVVTATLPATNQWTYVVGNYTDRATQLWINGSLANSTSGGGNRATSDPLYIGAKNSSSNRFNGQLDDLSFYKRSLTGPEIRAQYLYQLGLVAERQSYAVTIDSDNPVSVTVRSNPVFMPNRDRVMDLQAFDPTSSIGMVQLGTQKDGDASLTWANAQQCRDADDTSSWCITFAPHGEGRYTLQPRATDAVGHQATGSITTIDVDATAPQMTLTSLPTMVKPTKVANLGWTVTLSGSISDPNLVDGFAGSGVVTDSVLISLLNSDGLVLGSSAQRATVNGSTWTIDYAVPDAEPLGVFAIRAQAADRMGNTANFNLGSVRLDSVGPVAQANINAGSVISNATTIITSTTSLTGTVAEITVAPDASLYLPFEEVTRTIGYVGRAAAFDGTVGSTFQSGLTQTVAGAFSIAAWVKPATTSGAIALLGSRGPSDNGFDVKFQNGNRIHADIGNGSNWLTTAADAAYNYSIGQWYHLVYVVTPDSYTIYVNGVQQSTGTLSGSPLLTDASHTLWIGQNGLSSQPEPMNGLLDEVAVYARVLTTAEIRHMAQTQVAGVQGVEAAFTQLASGLSLESTPVNQVLYLPMDDSSDQNGTVAFKDIAGTATGTCAGMTCPATGALGMRGSAAQFDGVDDRVVISTSQAIAGEFTVAAWVKVNRLNATLAVMGSRAPGDNSFDFKFQNGNKIHGDIGTGTTWLKIDADADYNYQVGTWYHVAYAVNSTGYTIYVNGAPVSQGTFNGAPLLADANHVLRLGSYGASGEQFDGLIDDVRVYSWELGSAEIQGLYRGMDPVLKLDFENNFADSSAWSQAVTVPTAAQTPRLMPGAGIVGQTAAQFDGVDDRLTLAPDVQLANQSFSVMFWAKQARFGVYQFALGAGSAANNQGLQVGFTNQNQFECGFYANDLVTSLTSTDSNWHQWACTFDANTMRRTIYRDGTQVAQDTASANYQGGNNWTIGNSAWGNSPFQGLLDDVRVYPNALTSLEVNALAQTGFRSALVAPTGAGVTAGTWIMTPPAGLEGLYRLDVRGKDVNGLIDLTNLGNSQWTGMVDSLAPRIIHSEKFNYGDRTWHLFAAQDFNLDINSFNLSVTCQTGSTRPVILNSAGWPLPQYANPAWYRTGGGQPKLFEQWVLCIQSGANQPGAMLTVCDTAGNCTQQNSASPAPSSAANVDAVSAMVQQLTVSDRSTQASAAGGPGANITIQAPVADTVLSTTDPISITGFANSFLSLKAITVTVDGTPVYTDSYLAHAITSTNFAIDWTPAVEGAHVLQAEAADWGPDTLYTVYLPIMMQTGSIGTAQSTETQSALPATGHAPQVFSASEPITIYLDLTPPIVDFGSTIFTRTTYAPPIVRLSGSVTEAMGLGNVIVEVGDSALTANTDQADQWTADWPVDASALPDGVTYPITATAIDKAGHLTTNVITGVVDVVGPTVQPSITVDNQPLVAGLWITQTEPHTYTLTLPPAVDGSGTLGYWFGYSLGPTITLDALEFVPYATDTITLTRAITLPNDGQAMYLHVVAHDTLGNDTTETFGPVYLDAPAAPDYIGMNEPAGPYQGMPYRQWMDNSCSYLGQDLRVPLHAQPGAALAEAQKLYATWDHAALRITWTGADWNRDGDLFIYLDTIPDQMPDYPGTIPYVRHGSHVAYNPYSATQSSTLMLLPVQEWTSVPMFFPDQWPDLNRMNADYALWVENDTIVHLLQWNDDAQAWVETALPDTVQFNFNTDTGTPLTEFYLPLDVVSATIGSQVNLVAFASDDDALRVWSVLPSTNPASSSRVMANAIPDSDPFQFMLTDRYTFTLNDGNCRTPTYRTWLKVSPEPGGLAYTARDDEVRLLVPRFSAFSGAYSKVFQGYYTILDELVSRIDEPYQDWLTNIFCPANRYHPACGGTQSSLQEKLASHQDVDFSPLSVGERVTYTVHFINEQPTAKTFRSWFLPDPWDSVTWDPQPWVYGCPGWLDVTLPARSDGDLTLTGEVVTFTNKVNLKFEPPETLFPDCSAGGINPVEPYNNLTVYYEVDTSAPSYLAIDEPQSIIGQNITTLRGTVIDASPVPTITLEFSVDGAPAQSITCVNPTPTAKDWSCPLDIGAQVGGSLVDVRAQATDQFGNVSDFSPWLTLPVDADAPTTSLDVTTQDALADGVIGPSEATLSGSATDDHLLSGVDVCTTDDVCTHASTTLDPLTVPQTTYVYDDVPDTPIAIAANSGQAPTAPSGVNVPNVCGAGTVGIWRTFW